MAVEVKLPDLGEEAGDTARVSFFYVEEGQEVKKGENIVEMVTDKATFDIDAPADGVVKKILAEENQEVGTGEVLAIIEVPD